MDIPRVQVAIAALARNLNFQREPGPGAPAGPEGFFTGMIDFHDFYLGLCTDGVGTKLLLAEALGKWDTVGIDCMAMNVNDMICVGAEPLAFVDYLALAEADPEVMAAVGRGLTEGARQANVSIVGGESAMIPELVKHLDLAGTALGSVRKERMLDGSQVNPGDTIIGLPSSGPHSNGYTLIRAILDHAGTDLNEPFGESTVGLSLLEPTRIYVRSVMALLEGLGPAVHGLANITGGGWANMGRFGDHVTLDISEPLPLPPIFDWLQRQGDVTALEMYSTFNMGLGFAVVVTTEAATEAVELLERNGEQARSIGSVGRREKGEPAVVHRPLGLSWD